MFNQKEMSLLQDLKKSEHICTEKYSKYADQAQAPQLQNLFQSIAQQEQQHVQTLEQMIGGNIPSGSSQSGQSQQSGQWQKSGQSQQSQQNSGTQKSSCYQGKDQAFQNDSYLCSDALATEKHVSADYNTCIFEFKDQNVRNTLNHIQKEEQEHGKMVYDYMSCNGMYS